ncbi:hypothetical protein, partial [Curvivirga aplysinae]|uniref:hypothetical protein n=1 Tax=Curvivirga aplysinae TaxID=2529852 RepID=UPI0012BBAE10
MIKKIVLLITGLFLVGCVTNTIPEQAIKLDDDELRTVFTGKTVYGNLSDSAGNLTVPIIEYFSADKRVVYQNGKSKLFGMWRIADDLLCTRFYSEGTDNEYCWAVYRDGERYVDTWPSGKDK